MNIHMPKDDDLKDMTIGKERIPTMEELSNMRVQRFSQNQKYQRPNYANRYISYNF